MNVYFRADLGDVARAALGVPAPDLEILSVLPWQAEMLVADRHTVGRVHLAGDAAHLEARGRAAWRSRRDAAGQLRRRARARAGWCTADQSARRAENVSRTSVDLKLAHPFVLAAAGFQGPAPLARRRPLDARPGRAHRRGLPGGGGAGPCCGPDHVVAWHRTGDPEPVRKALLGGRLSAAAAVSG